MKPPLVSLLLVLAFALYPLERAGAIAMHMSSATFGSSGVRTAGGGSDMAQLGSLPVAFSISPLNGGVSLAASSWNFANTPTQAVWNGAQTLLNEGAALGYSSGASAYSEFRFVLEEPVSYSITSNFLAELGLGAQARNAARLEKRLGPDQDFHWDDVYNEKDNLLGAGFGELRIGDGNGVETGAATGIMEPGSYFFTYLASISGGEGGTANGSFSFTMTRSVPDAGSTLALLAMALCAIGGIFRKKTSLKCHKANCEC